MVSLPRWGREGARAGAAPGVATARQPADLPAQLSALERLLRTTPAAGASAASFQQGSRAFPALFALPNGATTDQTGEHDKRQLAVAVARLELGNWLAQTGWSKGPSACRTVLQQDLRELQVYALHVLSAEVTRLASNTTLFLQQGEAEKLQRNVPRETARIQALVAEAVPLAQWGARLASALPANELSMQCNDRQKLIDRSLASLHAWLPEAVPVQDLLATAYAHKTAEQMAQLQASLPQHEGLPLLQAASLVWKIPRPPRDGPSPGFASIGEKVLFPGGKMQKKVFRTVQGEEFTLHSADAARSGAHGKIFRSAATLGEGGPLVIKQQRTELKRRPGVGQSPGNLHAMLEKAALSAEGTRRIDAVLVTQPELFAQPHGALRGLTADASSAAMTHHFVDEFRKYYQVMNAMDGDLVDLHLALQTYGANAPAQQATSDARLSVAAQTFLQLSGLHTGKLGRDRGVAHRDLKLPNILMARTGSVRIIDLDEAKVVGKWSLVRAPYQQEGTLLSPEMYLPHLRRVKRSLGKPNDVWALGATLLDLGFDDVVQPEGQKPLVGPWFPGSNLGQVGGRTLSAAQQLALFSSWHAWVTEGSDGLRLDSATLANEAVSDAVAGAQAILPQGGPNADLMAGAVRQLHAFFAARQAQDPELTTTLLRHAMVPQPERRATAKQLSQAFVARMGGLDDEARSRVVDLFGRAVARV